MDRRTVIKIIGLSVLASIIVIRPVGGAEKALMVKMGTLAPEGSSWMKTFNKLNAELMQKTERQVGFKIYPGGILGDEKDMLRKMHIGQIQSAALTSGGLSVLFNEIDVSQVPFLFQNYGEVDYVLRKMDSFFKKGFEDSGYILLGWSEAGFVYLMSSSPISSVSDLKKVKVWMWEEARVAKAVFDEAGIAAIPLSIPDVLVGLQSGLVDVVYAPPTAAISLQWFTKVKNITNVPLVYVAGGIVMKKDIFRRMTPKVQSILVSSFEQHLDQLKTLTRNENRDAITVMEKHGMEIITPSAAQIDEFKRLADRAMVHVIDRSFSKKVLDEVSSHLERYRSGGR